MKIFSKAILPVGFKANGVSSGIKRSGKPDLGLIVSEIPAKVSGLFTSNKVVAAPVTVCKEHLKKNKLFRAIIVNSGNANCFTGKSGLVHAKAMAEYCAKALGIKKTEALVASTGIIGRKLQIKKIKQALPKLVNGLNSRNIAKASRAIVTTDKFVKECSAKLEIGGRFVTVCGIAKGAGMIFPDLKCATMLTFIMTDANISQDALDKALVLAVEDSFNSISVDGCQSTNDTVLLMANAAAGNKQIKCGTKDFNLFSSALKVVCLKLAKLIVQDGEGATKLIQIDVRNALSVSEAKAAAFSIANSNLFKAAMYGADPNFGRVVAALGACGIEVSEEKLKIKFSPLAKKEIFLTVDLNRGKYHKTVYASDLTHEYININASYN